MSARGHADDEALARVLRESRVDRSVEATPWSDYLETLLDAAVAWVTRLLAEAGVTLPPGAAELVGWAIVGRGRVALSGERDHQDARERRLGVLPGVAAQGDRGPALLHVAPGGEEPTGRRREARRVRGPGAHEEGRRQHDERKRRAEDERGSGGHGSAPRTRRRRSATSLRSGARAP